MINFYKYHHAENPLFSIIIPTWNNIDLLKFCINSIKKNSKFEHEIIVHINENLDNTKEWLDNKQISHSISIQNVGICVAMNAAFSLAQTDYIVYLNDDMYVAPNWDLYLKEEIDRLKTPYFYLSASLIEPVYTGNISVSAPYNFGQSPETFKEEEFLEKCKTLEIPDKNGSSWPPSLMHRKMWKIIGGFSIEFSPGMYSDPDISMKLWKVGVRYFKIVGKSKVYHFMSKSTKKVIKNNGRKQFLKKWKMSSSTFYKYYLRMGKPIDGELKNEL